MIAARVVGTGFSAVMTQDHKNGSYTLSFSGAVAGEARVVVRLDNTEMSPVTVCFVKGADDSAQSGSFAPKKEKEFEQTGDYAMACVVTGLDCRSPVRLVRGRVG